MSSRLFCRLFAPLACAAALFLNLSAPLPAQVAGAGAPTAAAAAAPQVDRVRSAVDAGDRVRLSGHRPAWVASATDMGPVPDGQTLHLVVGLSRSPALQAAFDQLTEDQQNPNSPRFHQWLTPAQVGSEYGPTQHDLDAVTAWLTGQGLTIDQVQPNRVLIGVSGSAALVSSAFQTSPHTYAGAGGTVQAPLTEPLVPQALLPVVQYIGGLSDVPRHTHMTLTPPTLNTATNIGRNTLASASPHPDIALTTANWIAPADFTVLYDLGSVYSAGIKGSGQRVMIIGGSRLNPPDLTYWESLSGLAAYSPNYIVGPGFNDPGQTNDDNMGEGTLDFERVYATAPSAAVDQVIAASWLSGTVSFNLISYAINTVNDPVLSMSFGSCEAMQPTGYVQQESALFQQAASQGISVFASSGDSGVDGCEPHAVAAQASQIASISDICASQYVTCVGGTEFNDTTATSSYWASTNSSVYESALRYIPEGGWNEPTTTNASGAVTGYVVFGSTGGASTIIAKPSWQTGTGVPADGFRDVPDVSFSASGHNAYFGCLAYAGGSCVPDAKGSFSLEGFSGTSASAPSLAGVTALLDQKLGGKQGNLNPLLYKVFNSSQGTAAFHDATIATSGVSGCSVATPSMCNNSDPSPTALSGGLPGYLLQPGFDLVTGLGSLDVANFLSAAVSTGLSATMTGVSANPTAPTSNQTVTLTAQVTSSAAGAPTGTVLFTNLGTASTPTSTALGTVTLSGGTASLNLPSTTFTSAGTYNVTAFYSGDGSYSASTGTLALVVTAPPLPATTTSLTGTATAISTQQTVSYTATIASTASGTPSGNVQFTRTTAGATSNLGAAVPLAGGKATLPPTSLTAGTYTVAAVYSGDTSFSGSTSTTLPLVVSAIPTITSLSGVPATVTAVTPIVPVAMVVPSGGATGNLTGTVQFKYVNGVTSVPLGAAVAVTNGVATGGTFYLPGNAAGYSVIATYSGDAIFATSSASSAVTSSSIATLIAFTPVPAAIQANAAVSLTATVSGLSAAVPTTGTVRFLSGSSVLGSAPVNAAGLATATVTLAPGANAVSASFIGDTTYLPSSTAAVSVTLPTFTLAAASPALTLASGSSASGTDVVTVTSTSGFAGSVTLSCVAALNSGAATVAPGCSLSPGSLTYPAGTQAMVTITTVAPHAVTGVGFASAGTPSGNLPVFTGMALSFAGLLGLCLPVFRRRYRWRALAAMLVLTGALAGLAGCGGKGAPPAPSGGTTTGAYTVTVTGISTTGIPAVTTTFSLTVN